MLAKTLNQDSLFIDFRDILQVSDYFTTWTLYYRGRFEILKSVWI